jgi:hypothetical protein
MSENIPVCVRGGGGGGGGFLLRNVVKKGGSLNAVGLIPPIVAYIQSLFFIDTIYKQGLQLPRCFYDILKI